MMDETAREPVLVDLALQGGGSHGAFTWGVLDRLIEESWLRIEAISGTSAGAMNAALVADGWTQGGAEGARAALDAYCHCHVGLERRQSLPVVQDNRRARISFDQRCITQ
jgi:predicted acylesterase/phospholipase RssA